MTTGRGRGRTALLFGLMILVSLVLALAASEILLRVIYRDGGRTTLGGPGGRDFVYTYLPDSELRGPLASGAKAPGVRRLMVMGDSITWGQGVTNWTDTYPARLLATLNDDGPRYDMAVYAYPGKEIDNHVATIAASIDAVQPDLVIYQWYNNDVEISKTRRPVSRRAWRSWPGHQTLRAWSYLYFSLDFALDVFLPSRGRTYLQYLEEDYAAGTPAWQAFARTFHTWAAYATGHASRTILMLYPPVPTTALADLRQRVAALAAGQVLSVVPAEMAHPIGAMAADGTAASVTSAAGAGVLAATPGIRLAHGDYRATVALRADAPAAGAAARIVVTHGPAAEVLAEMEVPASTLGAVGTWTTVTVPFSITAPVDSDVAIRVDFSGRGALSAGRVDLPVHYGIEVVDLAPHLAGVKTSASLFDAHPNAAAHAVMADVLAETVRQAPRPAAAP